MATNAVAPAETATPTDGPLPTSGLLVNAGFEVLDGDRPAGWERFGGVLGAAARPARSGLWAGAFYSDTDSTKWIYQTASVEPLAWYEMEAYVYDNDAWVAGAFLRVSWYTSPDGTGEALANVDSTETLSDPQPAYRRLTTGPVRAPPGVRSAKARVMLRPRSDVSAVIFVDDVSFAPADAPPAPSAEQAEAEEPESANESNGGSGSARSAAAARTSAVRAAARPFEEPVYTPMPLPIIRRHSVRTPVPRDDGDSDPWWPWAVAGAALGAGAVGWGAYLMNVAWRTQRTARIGTLAQMEMSTHG